MKFNQEGDYQKTKEYYDHYGSWYDKERIKGYYELINQREIEIVKPYGENKDVLEIGCGTGIILNEVTRFAHLAWGIDLSEGMLLKAKQKGLKVKQVNATKLSFPDDSFDLVYSFKALPHIPEIKQVIKEITRVVKKEGTLVLEFYNPHSLKRLTNWIYNMVKKRDVYLRYDSLKKIKSYLPDDWQIVRYNGLKILALGKKISSWPFFVGLEKRLANSFFGRFGGYLVVVIKKKK